ncbi:hypothetical protein DFQ27_000417 [Actinomortierella ambigua]|uniref:Uncharacterized protein n=1 Tax=Actinomortierella ambigua TaxID=1343610 RepID=A0A9P6UD09_9FUNG|nr:hypothetical protein DFQ27_000417 [Actinomortierella ambigua]
MMPWRSLGMLAFGLGVIMMFIRMHGDSYDFPTKVNQSNESLPLSHEHQRRRVDTVVLEVSTLFPEDPAIIYPESSHTTAAAAAPFFMEDEVPLEDVGNQLEEVDKEHRDTGGDPMAEDTTQQQKKPSPPLPRPEGTDHQLGDGRHDGQWPVGKRRSMHPPFSHSDQQDQQNQYDRQVATDQTVLRGGKEQPWAWLTMIQHESDTCSPGVVYQYGRPLESVLRPGDDNSWKLLYTHKLPGSIIHTSVSRRLVPLSKEIRARRLKERAERLTDTTRESALHGDAREAIRLAVLYKVVQDETAAYYLRVYHFGRFQPADKPLQDDCGGQKSDCYQHDPFVFFDYKLPGSMPFKDFVLEHDTIIYTRANDPYMFRFLKLPNLKVGATSQNQPYELANGSTGPKQACKDVLNLVYRTSDLALVPKSNPKEEGFGVLLAQVHEHSQGWTYETNIAKMDSSNQWTVVQGSAYHPEKIQETDSIYEETTSYVQPKPDPLIDIIQTLDPSILAQRYAGMQRQGNQQSQPQQHYLIDRVTFDVMDPNLGALSDDRTVMGLKTKRNNVLILKQIPMRPDLEVPSSQPWRMAMVLSDENYLYTPTPHRYKREVRAMRIFQVPRSQLHTRSDESDTTAKDDPNESRSSTEQRGGVEDPLQRILLMAFGDGHLVAYNLDEATPSSSTWTFIQEKYQVVIGMFAVVIVFVINEAR